MPRNTSRSFERQATIQELDLYIERFSETNLKLFERAVRQATYILKLEREAFALSAGVCEFRSGNEHGNAICLVNNELIETLSKYERKDHHGVNCITRVDKDACCNCGFC